MRRLLVNFILCKLALCSAAASFTVSQCPSTCIQFQLSASWRKAASKRASDLSRSGGWVGERPLLCQSSENAVVAVVDRLRESLRRSRPS